MKSSIALLLIGYTLSSCLNYNEAFAPLSLWSRSLDSLDRSRFSRVCNNNRHSNIHIRCNQQHHSHLCARTKIKDDVVTKDMEMESIEKNSFSAMAPSFGGSNEVEAVLAMNEATVFPDDSEESKDFVLQDVLLLLGLCWCVALLSALDRVAMSVALLPMTKEFGFSEAMKGSISSLFSVGYGLFILPCGFLVSKASPRIVMAGGVLVWSASTALTPIAAGHSFEALLTVRCIMGAAESVVLPTIQKLLVNWIPPNRKSLSIATIFSGFSMGTILAYMISPIILENFGWKTLFFIYGAAGSFWLIPWLAFAVDTPQEAINSRLVSGVKGVKVAEMKDQSLGQVLRESLDDARNTILSAPLLDMCKSKGVQAMAIAHAASNWGLYNNLAWSPTFYAEQYGLNVKESAFFSILPPVAGAISGILAALVADKFIEDGSDLTIVRRVAQGIGLFGPATCLLLLANNIPETPGTSQLLLTGALALQSFNSAGFGPAAQEKAGELWSGLLYSLTSLPGVAIGSFGVWITGQILDTTGRWDQVFALNGCINIFAALFFISFYDSRKEFD